MDKFCNLRDMFSVDRDANEAVETRIQIGWNKLRHLVPFLTNKDISLTVRGRFYSSCVQSSMLHGSETWSIRKENEVALQQAELRMVTGHRFTRHILPIPTNGSNCSSSSKITGI